MTADAATPPPKKKGKPRAPGVLAGLSGHEMHVARGRLGGAARAAKLSPAELTAIAVKANAAAQVKRAAERLAAGVPPAKPQKWGHARPSAEELAPFLEDALRLYPDATNYELRRKAQALLRNWLVRSEFGIKDDK